VYLAGNGLAAVEHGRIAWSATGTRRTVATAFADGSLAVGVGRDLRLVAPDGTIRQTLRVAEGETITAPPAIASDGAIWIATARGLYVAR
jgi:hypothetical protein